jgi:hypothetical protein
MDNRASRAPCFFGSIIYCLLSTFAAPRLWAAAGTEGASFLNIPVGAGPAALGSAYTALATDAYAPVYTPAGLGFLQSAQVAGQHLTYLGSAHDEYAGGVLPLRAGDGLGASVQYLGAGPIDATDVNGNAIGDFSASFASYNLSYGRRIGEQLSWGATAKWIHAKLSDVSANAMAGDLGVMYKPLPQWTVASAVTNAGNKLNFLGDGDNLPLAWHVGTAYRFVNPVMFTGETVLRRSGPSSFHMGLEWRVLPAAWWRIGYRTDTVAAQSQLAGFTTGIGLQMWGHELAYAWVPLGELGNTQYFSLLLRFGGDVSDRRNLIRFEHKKKPRLKSVSKDVYKAEPEQLMELLNEGKSPPKDPRTPTVPTAK